MKIVGIVLLTILCILIMLIALIAFVPIRYRIQGESHEELRATLRLRWLMGAFRLVGEYKEQQFTATFWILFWKLNKSDSVSEEAVAEAVTATAESAEADSLESVASETIEDSVEEDAKAKEKKDKIARKYRNLKHNIKKYKRILEDERNHQAVSHLKSEFLCLLKAIMPRKLKLEAVFSAGAPDVTGKTLGILAMFPIGYRNRWKLSADFESDKAYIDGTADMKGRIYVFQMVGILLRLWMDKDCKRLYHWLTK